MSKNLQRAGTASGLLNRLTMSHLFPKASPAEPLSLLVFESGHRELEQNRVRRRPVAPVRIGK